LKLDWQNDSPISSERIVSTERPFSPFIKICRSESIPEDYATSERRENSCTELPIFSPANLTGAELLAFSLQNQRESSNPFNLNGAATPGDDQLSEILRDEVRNSPPRSVNKKASQGLKFSQEAWTEMLSKKKCRFVNQ